MASLHIITHAIDFVNKNDPSYKSIKRLYFYVTTSCLSCECTLCLVKSRNKLSHIVIAMVYKCYTIVFNTFIHNDKNWKNGQWSHFQR